MTPRMHPAPHALAGAVDDCWNRIGMGGDQSCPVLPAVIHCRNCGVYAEAAQHNLQRPVDAAYRAEWAAHFSEPLAQAAGADQAALVFRVGREWLALPAACAETVAPLAPRHKLPHRRHPGLLGIVSVGGKLKPLISLEAILGIDSNPGTGGDHAHDLGQGRHVFPRLLVVQLDGQRYAVPVAELHGIARYSRADLAAPPATVNKGLVPFVTGVLQVGSMRVGVLDAALLGGQLAGCLR
jgi:chemotaxis-related protein WspD